MQKRGSRPFRVADMMTMRKSAASIPERDRESCAYLHRLQPECLCSLKAEAARCKRKMIQARVKFFDQRRVENRRKKNPPHEAGVSFDGEDSRYWSQSLPTTSRLLGVKEARQLWRSLAQFGVRGVAPLPGPK